jgi:hypothetical protein
VTPGIPVQPQPNPGLDRERARVAKLLEETAQLSEQEIPPTSFYGELLKKLLDALLAPAGSIWLVNSQGNLAPLCQINLKEVGLDERPESLPRLQVRASMVQLALSQAKPGHVMPNTLLGDPVDGRAPPGNPTDFVLLTVPLIVNGQVQGLIEVFQRPNRPPQAIPGFLQFMGLMAEVASRYQRNQKMGSLLGQQQLWTQLEQFARQVHQSLNPVEVAYLVANEGRRLIECDRISVALRYGTNTKVEAVSGSDVVESRSNQVQLLRKLCESVLIWGEKLVYRGTRDDGLPPRVLTALDAYLAESQSRLLVIQPLRDDRQKDTTQQARAVIVMECFDPPEDASQLMGRLDIIARHATPALYNAVEHRRIPLRFLWLPLARIQEGVGGKARAILLLVAVLLTALVAALVFVPYPLKMEATGSLRPTVEVKIYPPVTGFVNGFVVRPGEVIQPKQDLVKMWHQDQMSKITGLRDEINRAKYNAAASKANADGPGIDEQSKQKNLKDAEQSRITAMNKEKELTDWLDRTGAAENTAGYFTLRAPEFNPEQMARFPAESRQHNRTWTVLSSGFATEWTNKEAKPSDALLTLGAKDAAFEIELRIPQKHIGQILKAYKNLGVDTLDVDFLLRTHPTQPFKGKLHRSRVSNEVINNKEDGPDTEPYVPAFVTIDDPDIESAYRMPLDLIQNGTVAGAEVHAKVRCGPARLGYALFYGVWEFLYERVVFFF